MSTWQSRGVYAPVQGWDADFSFLAQAASVTQSRYDRGFNQIKSVYNSLLNSPLTNEGNIAYRDEMFKRLEETLKKNSALDFSKAENVSHVMGLLDPLTKDKDLAYDMAVTRFHKNEKAKMESYRTSDDPEKRKLYSDYAAKAINLAEQNLSNAVRGDGTIQQVSPQEFVPFEDITGYLNEVAKEQKLEIKVDYTDPSGYIITDKNGEKAVPNFTAWAQMQMGNKFDRQLQLQAKVMTEDQIATRMQEEGISRDDAVMRISEEMLPQVTESNTSNVRDLTADLKKLNSEINIIEKYYANGIPANNPSLKTRYDKLVEQRNIHEQLLKNGTNTLKRIDQEGIDYMRGNLVNGTYSGLKKAQALQWGTITALSTAEREIKSDATWTTKYNNQVKLKMHEDDMTYKAADLKLRQEKLAFDYWKEMQPGSSSGSKSKKSGQPEGTGQRTLLGEEQYIDYIGTAVTGTKFKSDVLKSRMNKNFNVMFNALTQADNGLMQLILPDENVNNGINAMNTLKGIADGTITADKLTDEHKDFIVKYGNEIGLVLSPNNLTKNDARIMIEAIAGHSYTEATEKLQQYSRTGTLPEKITSLEPFNKVHSSLKTYVEDQDAIERSLKNIAAVIAQSPDTYEDAKMIGRSSTGTPIYDVSGLDDDAKNNLDAVVANEFNALTAPIGQRYNLSGLTSGQLEVIMNENLSNMYDEGGDIVKQTEVFGTIKDMPKGEMAALFGDMVELTYDPVKEVVAIDVAVKESGGEARAKDLAGQKYRVEIPYDKVRANAGIIPEIAKGMQLNTPTSASAGIFSDFLTNSMANVKSTSYQDAAGFSFDIQGANFSDGYGVNAIMKIYNYPKGTWETFTQKIPITNPGDPTTWTNLNNQINEEFSKFMMSQGHMKAFEKEMDKIALKLQELEEQQTK